MRPCPICTTQSKLVFETKYAKVFECTNKICGHLFAGKVKPFSGVHNFEDDMEKDYSEYSERNRALIKYWKRIGFIKPDFKLLDFGSGTGHILRSLREEFPDLHITAIEFNELFHGNYEPIGINAIKDLNLLSENEKFDAITIIEVAEHLDNPIDILAQLKKRLKKDGKLFITTPAGDFRKSCKRKWELSAYNSPFHIQFFTEKALQLCLKKAGFSKISYRYIDEFYPSRNWGTFEAKYRTLKQYYSYWKGYTEHLTYFTS